MATEATGEAGIGEELLGEEEALGLPVLDG